MECHARPTALMLISILAAVLGLTTCARAWASDPFPVQETFAGAAFGSPWRHGGSAELTGGKEAEGWLRLTSGGTGEFGYAYDNEAFPSTDGALVEFEYADWGGSGADGLTFFLFDGSTGEAEFHAGQPGGSLGYAPCYSTTNGLSGAYVGVGFDEYGNFSNLGSICGLDGYEFLANHVSIRGSAAESYRLLATAPTSESLRAERVQARHVTIAVTPTGKLSVYLRYPDGTYQQVTENFQLPAAPGTLKFGYVASTGSLTDYHEIRGAQVVKPTQLTPSIAQSAGGRERGKPLTWTAVVRNEGPNPTQREQLRTTVLGQAPANASWTCEAAGGAECGTTEGAGLPDPEAGAMPSGSTLTYRITGTPTPSTDYAQMTLESEPRGDTGELDPERERATARTDLVPLFGEEPTFTLAADGEASATTVGALGGEISYGYAWQRCEADGTACANIPGAQAPLYHTTNADLGHTIRFTETATNDAGSATVDSASYRLPTAEITSAPAGFVATREAVLSFTASTTEAELECSLDGAAWSACASPLSYEGLADGEHTFSVRATHGGLGDPNAASVQWTTEATPPPAPTIVSVASSPTAPADTAFRFGDLIAADTLECQLDSGKWQPCAAFTELTGLAEGGHHLQVRQVSRAGLASSVTGYAWKIEAAAAASPTLTPTPTPESVFSSPSPTAASVVASTAAHGRRSVAGQAHEEKVQKHHTGHRHAPRAHRHPAAHRPAPRAHRHPAAHRHAPRAHRQATSHRRPAPGRTHRHAAQHRRGGKRQHGSERTPKATVHEHRPQHGRPRHAGKHRHAERRPPTTKRSPERRHHAAEHRSEVKTRRPAGKPRHSATTRRHDPKLKTPPPAAGHRTTAQTPPAGRPAPGHSSPAPTVRRRPTIKTSPSINTPPRGPKTTTRTGRTPKRRTRSSSPAPAPAPHRERHAPPSAPRAGGKVHGPVGRRAPKHARRRTAGSIGRRLVIRPFRPQSSALVSRARRRIERIAAAVHRARLIVCIGYTDNLGPRSANVALGLRRARAVCGKLRALGVHAAFKAEGRGPDRPCASNATASGRALNRRVELRIVY